MKERKDKKMQHILESLFLDTALPFRVRLFNILAIVGVLISVMNGIFSYMNRFYLFHFYIMHIKAEIISSVIL